MSDDLRRRAIRAKGKAAQVGIKTHGIRMSQEQAEALEAADFKELEALEEAIKLRREKELAELQEAVTKGYTIYDSAGLHHEYTLRCVDLYDRLYAVIADKGLKKRIEIACSPECFIDPEFDLLIVLKVFLYDSSEDPDGDQNDAEVFSIGIDCRNGEHWLRCFIGPNPDLWFEKEGPEVLRPQKYASRAWLAERMGRAEEMALELIETVSASCKPDQPLLEESFDFGF